MMELRAVTKSFGSLELFRDFHLGFGENEVTCLVGPSGCGKTTLLGFLAGLVKIDSGSVVVPEQISFVFQESRLLPWRTLRENAAYAMDSRLPSDERDDRLEGMLKIVELDEAAGKYPEEVSGGMARRCALARALLAPFDALLLDEPLSSLDPELRLRLLDRLPGVIARRPVVLVTHDYGVASNLADRIYRLDGYPAKCREVDESMLQAVIDQIDDTGTVES